MQYRQIVRRDYRKNPEVIAAVKPSPVVSALQAIMVVSTIAAAFYSLALGGLI